MRSSRERFDAKVLMCPVSGCWLWTAACDDKGYGWFWVKGGPDRAHRVAWALFVGEVTHGMDVLHTCDNPTCVNPAHLFLGTNADNVADRIAKGRTRHATGHKHGRHTQPHRTARGERHGYSKLNAGIVAVIRQMAHDGVTQAAIATRYGIHQTTVSHVVLSKTWAHIKDKT